MLVSVVLPAYNAELYLKEAIDSVLAQTCTDFELIILNDGSVDRTEEIILSYSDSRIVYVKNEQNLGLIGTLNKGINLAKGKYIARMDADDICLPERFEKQINFLENNNDYIICGTAAYRFYSNYNLNNNIFRVPKSDELIRLKMLFNSPFIHPSIMMRSSIVKEKMLNFDIQYKYAEDYKFWSQLLKYGKAYNLQEKLLYYRLTPNSQTVIGNSDLTKRKLVLGEIQSSYIREAYGIVLNDNELDLLFYLSNLDRMKMLNFAEYDLIAINNFFNYIVGELISKNISRKDLSSALSKVYFSLIFIKFKENKNSIFLKNINKKLFLYGFFHILKERIAR
ncbi:glycosyltransferase family 2 protein [Acinetobacter lactucae]|uniref:Glycosyltransferase family 2 protein n=1 Tax=Acinetobacter lactucae TaxID=1785128 RepID=A0A3R9QEN8_9GAMM|nr:MULTISPECIES: glycosyltransferase family 2 protein [Acinetobacter calcoaceticus/baumannii complex]MCG9494124.1 glycosyltransferase [Acinetobacter pittii]MCU4348987.1 glycosyltransferase [Acinetobacter lactucae]RSO54120.1 glycosyltransferase family 2 protein [Acinetobacter lactucae]